MITALCHHVLHCHNFCFWLLSPSLATVNNVMYWEHSSCLYFPCKLHRKACWRCLSLLITVGTGHCQTGAEKHKNMVVAICVFMRLIHKCVRSICWKVKHSSSRQFIIHYIAAFIFSEETVINYTHLSLRSSLHHPRWKWISFSHICDPAVLGAPRKTRAKSSIRGGLSLYRV